MLAYLLDWPRVHNVAQVAGQPHNKYLDDAIGAFNYAKDGYDET